LERAQLCAENGRIPLRTPVFIIAQREERLRISLRAYELHMA
jgi:hypothetical protein